MINFEKQNYNYDEFEGVISAILCDIRRSGESLIGVWCKRTPFLIYLLEKLFENGIAFISIDSVMPRKRVDYIIQNSKLSYLITDKETDCGVSVKKKRYYEEFKDESRFKDYSLDEMLKRTYDVNPIAYILYTSGSTGRPKGVVIMREGVLNFFKAIDNAVELKNCKRIASFTSVSFDIFFLESLYACYKKMDIVLANEEEQINPKLMTLLIEREKIDVLQLTPSRMQLLNDYDKELKCLVNIKTIMIGGEVFNEQLFHRIKNATSANIYNMYGPTETTIWSTIANLTDRDYVDIGLPILNTNIYIVDNKMNILPNGMEGEICIAGKGLAKGYVNNSELTSKKFVSILLGDDVVKVYKTGDLGKIDSQGRLRYVGRIDNQVKIRGFRIEPEEIEWWINQYDGVCRSVVIPNLEKDRLDVFYTGKIFAENDMIKFLSNYLPDYMIPQRYNCIEDFKYTLNGKIDRNKMYECIIIESKEKKINSVTDYENEKKIKISEFIYTTIADIVSENEEWIDFNLSLENMGINSLSFINFVVAIESKYEFEFDDDKLVVSAFKTIDDIVDYVISKIEDEEH